MKILVLGANGMAGHTITLYFLEQGHDVTAFTRSPISFCKKNILGNAFDTKKLKQYLLSSEYDAVINCIGLLNKEAEENPYDAIFINSLLPHFITKCINTSKTKLIHMSTDCVFQGNTGPYYEHSLKDGKTLYDRTKALGEINDKKNLTFRNSIIGPDINKSGIGLFNWFMKQHGSIDGYTNAIWTGVTTLTLAKAMEKAIEEDLTGIYNLVNNKSISKYDLLCLFNKNMRNNKLNINRFSSFKLDKTLKRKRSDFSFNVPSYEQMILEMKEWIYSHQRLYPHYF